MMRKLFAFVAVLVTASAMGQGVQVGGNGSIVFSVGQPLTLSSTTDPPTFTCSSTVNNLTFAVSTALNVYQCSNNNFSATYVWNLVGIGGVVPIANGGTGASTATGATQNLLGYSGLNGYVYVNSSTNTATASTTIPILGGGTGSATAAGALANLGAAGINQANTYGAYLQDFSTASMKQPSTYTVGPNTITNPTSAGTLALTSQLFSLSGPVGSPLAVGGSFPGTGTTAVPAGGYQTVPGLVYGSTNAGVMTTNTTNLNAALALGAQVAIATQCEAGILYVNGVVNISKHGGALVGYGNGQYATCPAVIEQTANTDGVVVGATAPTDVFSFQIRNLNIVGPGSGSGTRVGLHLTNSTGLTYGGGAGYIENVNITGFSQVYVNDYFDNITAINLSGKSDATNSGLPEAQILPLSGGTSDDSSFYLNFGVGCSGGTPTAHFQNDSTGRGARYYFSDLDSGGGSNPCNLSTAGIIVDGGSQATYYLGDIEALDAPKMAISGGSTAIVYNTGGQGASANTTAPVFEVKSSSSLEYHGIAETTAIATNYPAFTLSTTFGGSGTLLDSHQYCYVLVGYNPSGHTAYPEQCITTGSHSNTNNVVLTITPLPGITYMLPGRGATGAESLFSTAQAQLQGSATTWTDTGVLTPAGALPGAATLTYPQFYEDASSRVATDMVVPYGVTTMAGQIANSSGEIYPASDHIVREISIPSGAWYNRGQYQTVYATTTTNGQGDVPWWCGVNTLKSYACSPIALGTGAAFTGPISAPSINNTCMADQQAGADMGAKIAACNVALCSGAGNGGIINAEGFLGTQYASVGFTVGGGLPTTTSPPTCNVTLKLGYVTLWAGGAIKMSPFSHITGQGSSIFGSVISTVIVSSPSTSNQLAAIDMTGCAHCVLENVDITTAVPTSQTPNGTLGNPYIPETGVSISRNAAVACGTGVYSFVSLPAYNCDAGNNIIRNVSAWGYFQQTALYGVESELLDVSNFYGYVYDSANYPGGVKPPYCMAFSQMDILGLGLYHASTMTMGSVEKSECWYFPSGVATSAALYFGGGSSTEDWYFRNDYFYHGANARAYVEIQTNETNAYTGVGGSGNMDAPLLFQNVDGESQSGLPVNAYYIHGGTGTNAPNPQVNGLYILGSGVMGGSTHSIYSTVILDDADIESQTYWQAGMTSSFTSVYNSIIKLPYQNTTITNAYASSLEGGASSACGSCGLTVSGTNTSIVEPAYSTGAIVLNGVSLVNPTMPTGTSLTGTGSALINLGGSAGYQLAGTYVLSGDGVNTYGAPINATTGYYRITANSHAFTFNANGVFYSPLGYGIGGNTVIPSTVTGSHGGADVAVQLSDGTGGTNVIAKYDASGGATASSITDDALSITTSEIVQGGNTMRLTSNATPISATTPGTVVFTKALPAKAANYSFHCELPYNQQTAAGGVGLAVQGATTAPTRLDAWATIYTNNTGTSAQGVAQNITSTTATSVLSATPSAITTVFQAKLDGTIQVGASGTTFNVLMYTGAGADTVTPQAGSYCAITP